ncbi:ABC transporter permease [Streptomyces tropicalis]|uniref:ABC transporter permease n=1 Tax=Streptomyces tropicalis TaxID=3034234 RepID=A0ABT6A1V2_9ACTN|nr:ABC transporter permease [Streptomyces tropicalis]MDF3298619.1 ABC transporter permease [Streptomyces tropicalis]
MFVAWRDLRFAKGRFALMGTVVVLITLLVGLLSGLTAGLAGENTSAVRDLPADHLAFAAPPGGQPVSFTGSSLPPGAVERWAARAAWAEPVAVRTLQAQAQGRTAAVSVFAVRPESGIAPRGVAPGRAVLSVKAAAALGATAGDRVRLGAAEWTVAAVAGGASYSHTPVVWTAWAGGPATVIALRTHGADVPAADRAAGTRTLTRQDALSAIGSYRAENGSLQLMRGFLFAISALVVGAFFTVWTIQRAPDIAVLKALGASTPYLLRDALGQAVLLLTAGTLGGTGLAVAAGAAVRGGDVPFALDLPTVLLPAAVTVLLGVAGAALSVRRITAVDPLTALGGVR